tara:strand:+ start:936 stop:1145 length:210 start_codon:yes stop_codon:yes gene_type:complete
MVEKTIYQEFEDIAKMLTFNTEMPDSGQKLQEVVAHIMRIANRNPIFKEMTFNDLEMMGKENWQSELER